MYVAIDDYGDDNAKTSGHPQPKQNLLPAGESRPKQADPGSHWWWRRWQYIAMVGKVMNVMIGKPGQLAKIEAVEVP